MKKVLCVILIFCIVFSVGTCVCASATDKDEGGIHQVNEFAPQYDCTSFLLMEAETGTVLSSSNENAALPLASVTKIMTLLLAVEALEAGAFSLDDKVSISSYAASMGGSQVFLEEGELISVEDLLKCAIIASANDAAVALAELVSGSESAFVRKMNARAMELQMSSTNFENVTGLDDTTVNHVSSAKDIAIMSRALISHDIITKYSSIWQDTIRNGEFTLTNTNRLVRFYNGCNGLKTGSTDKAGFCISATAKRDGMQLIAVVMGAPKRDTRNEIARQLLDYGFSSYSLFTKCEESLGQLKVLRGREASFEIFSSGISVVVPKTELNSIEALTTLPQAIKAPLSAGDSVGKIEYLLNGQVIATSDIFVKKEIESVSFTDTLIGILNSIFLCKS